MGSLKTLLASIVYIALLQCTVSCSSVNTRNIEHVKNVPLGISSAFITNGSIWIVPQKESIIISVLFNGEEISVSESGTYLLIPEIRGKLSIKFLNGHSAILTIPERNRFF